VGRLKEEVRFAKQKLEQDLKKQLVEEKRRLQREAEQERDALREANKQLMYEISRLKVLRANSHKYAS